MTEKEVTDVWAGISWLTIQSSCEILWTRYWTIGLHTGKEFFLTMGGYEHFVDDHAQWSGVECDCACVRTNCDFETTFDFVL